MGVEKDNVTTLISEKLKSPAILGVFRPRLLLPEGFFTRFDQQQQSLDARP